MKTVHGLHKDDVEDERSDDTSEVEDGQLITDHSEVTTSADAEKTSTDSEEKL